jgi:predicted transcriptional regulator
MDEVRILQSLGLSKKESLVYLALLELGSAPAQKIADEAGVKKPTTYLALEDLRMRGLVTKIPNPRKVLYRANSPYELETVINTQVQKAQRLLPALAARHKDTTGVKITFYEGASGIRSAYRYNLESLRSSTDYAFYGISEKITIETSKTIIEWRDLYKTNNIKTIAIAPQHPSLDEYRGADNDVLVETTVVPLTEYSSRISVESVGTIVRIVLLETNQAIVIEDKSVAEAFKEIFKLALKGAKSNE